MSETTIKFLHDWEKEQLFNVIAMDQSTHNIRNKAIFYIAEYAGLRASEVGLIKVTDFNMYKQEIYIKRLKNSNPNTLRILERPVLNALIDYLDYREAAGITHPNLFISQKGKPISRKTLDMIMKRYCTEAEFLRTKHTFTF